MSFIGAVKEGNVYAPGYFLAHEECVRETRQFAQNSALVQTTDEGGKYVPMGTAYPTNDGNAIGITYEDVDVTTGNLSVLVATPVIDSPLNGSKTILDISHPTFKVAYPILDISDAGVYATDSRISVIYKRLQVKWLEQISGAIVHINIATIHWLSLVDIF